MALAGDDDGIEDRAVGVLVQHLDRFGAKLRREVDQVVLRHAQLVIGEGVTLAV